MVNVLQVTANIKSN